MSHNALPLGFLRIGQGYDVHKFGGEGPIVIGGETIQYDTGLLAHSDGDVLLHAICDAILGALALRDIGYHFPDTAEEFKNIDSRLLLRKVILDIHERGYAVNNIDSTIVAQAPKMAPYINAMRQNIAEDCQCQLEQINVKATTTEKLGFTGRKEGIASYANVLLVQKPQQPE
ncbi:2-C-methyl-D-erythritol 2,4-cyclodiphosphate synthase [Alteromonas sp. a30]|uniref:2-C-methyl-D-erythritol 2,4-cyclodiphosphate synthase n=1 Tax=Alteromonas sp. a30 TaxID=2730917 RepID=UPI0022804B63|nr:2-C-methyl-D-erythritol 2,4-cyclodiphosphate synthase [Alteromonas sp. a30]MCY7294281.1 2-C-methyl-D-erythritol 2,4-cyclodiphosphate synthase [Alteromonas sp. a30]